MIETSLQPEESVKGMKIIMHTLYFKVLLTGDQSRLLQFLQLVWISLFDAMASYVDLSRLSTSTSLMSLTSKSSMVSKRFMILVVVPLWCEQARGHR